MNRFVRRAAALLAAAVLFVTMAAAVGPSSAARAFEGVFVSLSVPAASPQRPTVTARVRFANLKAGYSRVCTLVWYQNGVPVRTDRDFTLTPGAVAECPVTTVFSAGTPKTAAIGCKLVSGSESVYTETDMELKNFSKRFYARLKASSDPYAISVVRSQNVVLVYALGEDGQHSVLQNAFLCSTGPGTPTGTYSLSDRYPWRALFRTAKVHTPYVYGQYATRITGDILFHSVPYETQDPADLKTEEFNKLGTEASLGCIRLMVAGVKWIYDNCPPGTVVRIYDADTLPVARPAAPVIDETAGIRWDPTDPDPANPW